MWKDQNPTCDVNILLVETPDEPEAPHPKEDGPEKNLARLLEKVEGCSVRAEVAIIFI